MLLRIASAMVLLSLMAGCNASKPAPQPLSAGPRLTQQEAAQAIRNAEAKQPCSSQNLLHASEAQKRACDPTAGMFDNIKPAPVPQAPHTSKVQMRKAAEKPVN